MQRICFTLQVRRERLEEYRERHTEVWPEMQRALRSAGWRNYSLYLREDGLLIGYLETPDWSAALRAMAATDVNARWQASMEGLFEVPASRRPDEAMVLLAEVFHLD